MVSSVLLLVFLLCCNSTTKRLPILVTGGNKGIGNAICRKLLEEYPNVHVLLGSRSVERGQQAIQELTDMLGADACRNRLDFIEVDTSSDESVEAAAKHVKTLLNGTPLYAICNNAGISSRGVSDLNEVLEVNYFGPQRVCQAFSDQMQRPGGRIVNIGSGGAPKFVSDCSDAKLKQELTEPWAIEGGIEGLNDSCRAHTASTIIAVEADEKEGGDGDSTTRRSMYGFTKAALHAYTWLLARQEPELVVNAVSPGWILTDMTAGGGATTPPSKGAVPPVYLLMDDEVARKPTGRYYGSDCKRSPWHIYRSPGSEEYVGPDGPPPPPC